MIRTFQDRAWADMRELAASLPFPFRDGGRYETGLPEADPDNRDDPPPSSDEAFYWGCCIHSHW